MPLFEYRCSACAHLEEVLQKLSDPAPAVCEKCGAAGTLAKEISRTSFQLKGGGWYKDLYSSTTSSTSSESKPASSTPSESAPAASSTSSESKPAAAASSSESKPAASTPSSSATSAA